MTCKERFVARDVFHTYDIVTADFDDLVNQQERVTMREQFADTVDIHNRSAVRIIDGSLNFVQFDVLADHACQLVVDFMSRTGSDYAASDRFADQCQVTDHIDQLVACRLVVEYQRFIVDVA